MALTDIVTLSGCYDGTLYLPSGSLGTIIDIVAKQSWFKSSVYLPARASVSIIDIVEKKGLIGLRESFKHTPGWPSIIYVTSGIKFGPTGVEFTGISAGGGQGEIYVLVGGVWKYITSVRVYI